jgi:hypothetical protein
MVGKTQQNKDSGRQRQPILISLPMVIDLSLVVAYGAVLLAATK